MSFPRNEPPAGAPPPGCPSGKVAYERRTTAGEAARHIRGRGGPPTEPYACSLCPAYHLRSNTDRKFAKGRRR